MGDNRKIAITATDPLGRKVVAHQSTLASHRLKHQEPFSDNDIIEVITEPDMIAGSGHDELAHKERYIYYKKKEWGDGGPPIMKTIVEHSKSPGEVTSAFRTSKFTQDSAIVYISSAYLKGTHS